jgi:hypothetical protein
LGAAPSKKVQEFGIVGDEEASELTIR